MLLTLTAFTTVVLSIAENIRAAVQREQLCHTPARTHALCEEGNSLSCSPGLQEGMHWPAQPLHKSQGVPHLALHVLGFTFPAVCLGWMRGARRLRFLSRICAPCLEGWQSLSFPALALMARTLQPLSPSPKLHPQAWHLLHQCGRILSFPKRPAHRSTCGISLNVSGIISWAISVCTQEQ